MSKYVKMLAAVAAIAGYFMALRYVAPSHEPYYIMGIALIGLVSWMYGIVVGLTTALLLMPVTHQIYSQFNIATSYLTSALSPAYIALEILAAVSLGRLRQTTINLSKKEASLAEANDKLQTALFRVRELGGVHSICSSCHQILSDDGEWMKIDTYLLEKTKMEFSHAMCPDCVTHYHTPKAEDISGGAE